MFSSSFMISFVMFKSLFNFELIFVCGVMKRLFEGSGGRREFSREDRGEWFLGASSFSLVSFKNEYYFQP